MVRFWGTKVSRFATIFIRMTSPPLSTALSIHRAAARSTTSAEVRTTPVRSWKRLPSSSNIRARRSVLTYVDTPRVSDHICYYSDLRRMKAHYPGWAITKTLQDTIREIVDSMAPLRCWCQPTRVTLPAIDLERTYDRRFGDARDYRLRVWSGTDSRLLSEARAGDGHRARSRLRMGRVRQSLAGRRFGMDLNSAAARAWMRGHGRRDSATDGRSTTTSPDAVFTSNFFEHLPDKSALQATVLEAFRTLKSGGRLICLGPNIKCVPGKYWDFWDHHSAHRAIAGGVDGDERFSHRTLSAEVPSVFHGDGASARRCGRSRFT